MCLICTRTAHTDTCRIYLVIRWGFLFQNYPKSLDPSYKTHEDVFQNNPKILYLISKRMGLVLAEFHNTDLQIWGNVGRATPHLIAKQTWYVITVTPFSENSVTYLRILLDLTTWLVVWLFRVSWLLGLR